jgi:hypothetical protein
MRHVVFPFVALMVIGLSACGGEAPPPKAPEPPAPAQPAPPPPPPAEAPEPAPAETKAAEPAPEPALVVQALKFVPAKGSKVKAMELKDDGSIMEGEKVVAKIAGDTLEDAEGKTIATVSKDGTVTIPDAEKPLKFSDINELESDAGMKISVADDGTPTKVANAKAKPNANLGKFEGFNPKVRRAAALMLALDELKKEAATAAKAAAKAKKAAEKAEKAAAAKGAKAEKAGAKAEKGPAEKPKPLKPGAEKGAEKPMGAPPAKKK